jgi:signal transduction histidine kinase
MQRLVAEKPNRKKSRPQKKVSVPIEPDRVEKRAAAFLKLGRQLNAVRTPKEAGAIILSVADELFPWDSCIFDLVSVEQGRMETVICVDTINGRRFEFPSENCSKTLSIAGRRRLGKAELILRPQGANVSAESNPFGDKNRRSASLMYAPLKNEQKAIGFLSFQSYSPNAYAEEDLSTLQALADQCGGALERIRAEEEITRLNHELRHRLGELQALFECAPVGIAVSQDAHCRVITGNPAFAAMMGVEAGSNASATGPEASKLPFKITREGNAVPPPDLPMQKAAREGLTVREELEFTRQDGTTIHVYVSATPLFDEHRAVRGSLGVMVDLTERKRAEAEALRLNHELERRVRERTAQLEAINKELEAFSYSVSHDLRAPLRSIRGFSEVLLERYAPQLDARGQDFLRRTCQSSHHMDKLIDDLLKLSRVGRSELTRRSIDLSEMASNIAAELRKAEPERDVEVVVAPGLEAQGDERLVRVALENLLRNAWKFTGRRNKARIEFGVTDGAERAYFVRDNGAGFDMAYATRLFGVFQRLHAASEFPGTGIGLATVQRIINRHGGRAWANGKTDEGATFYFTLPDHDNPPST